MKLNNLKTLSLSALMVSSMIGGAFAMDPDGGIDSSNPLRSGVSGARSVFEKGESPVRRTPQPASKTNVAEDEGASGLALVILTEQKEAKAKIAKLKADSDAIKCQLEEEVNAARNSAEQQIKEIEKHRQKMELEMGEQRQLLQAQLDELSSEISSKRDELNLLTSALEKAKGETAAAKSDAILTKSGVAAAASYFNPMNYMKKTSPTTTP